MLHPAGQAARSFAFAAIIALAATIFSACGGGVQNGRVLNFPVAQGPSGAFDYRVGADYHAYTGDFQNTTFLPSYDAPGVRDTVRAQLQGMADRGATVVSTRIWFASIPGSANPAQPWQVSFPIDDHDAANLHAYAQDVAAVQSASGSRLRLELGFFWLGDADYQVGSPAAGLGYSHVTASDFASRVATSTDRVLSAIGDVTRPDGIRVVDTIYLDLIQIEGTPNQDWFLETTYARFVSAVSSAGFEPSLCFLVEDTQSNILQDGYVDPAYPVLNGHRSVRGMYRSIKFLADRGYYIPRRIDFAYYIHAMSPPYSVPLTRVLDDADATLTTLGAPRSYGIAETYYYMDAATRHDFGQAFAAEAKSNFRLRFLTFWTVPDGDPNGGHPAYPFAFEDYL